MTARSRWELLGLLAVGVGSIGCSRANVYAITDEPSPDGSTGDVSTGEGSSDDLSTDDLGTGGDLSVAPVLCPAAALPAGNTTRTVQVGSSSRSYVLHVPATYDGTKQVPLILDFHGMGSSATSESKTSPYPEVTDPEGVVIAFPDGTKGTLGGTWNMGPCCIAGVDDMGFVMALVARIKEIACIDPDRVYAVGVLTGGGMVYDLACNAADVFAAVAPAAFDLLKENVDECQPSRPITVISFRGTDDSRVPYTGGPSSLVPTMPINFLGAKATFEEWAKINECTGSPSQVDSHGCSSYGSCRDGVEVTLCTKEGGREEPGDATIAWPVLKRYTLPTR
jgi:polyhydroxybutyrate depolymerase